MSRVIVRKQGLCPILRHVKT